MSTTQFRFLIANSLAFVPSNISTSTFLGLVLSLCALVHVETRTDANADTIRTVVFTGDKASGISDDVDFVSFRNSVLNERGQVTFLASVTGDSVDSTNNRGIWSEGTDQKLRLIARNGDQAPGIVPGVRFSGLFQSNPVLNLNDAGNVSFLTSVTGTGVDEDNDIGIWSQASGGELRLVAREGDQAPGTPNGVNFTSLFAPRFNNAGHTAFFGALAGTGIEIDNDVGIWSDIDSASLNLVALAGDQAPGLPNNVNFSDNIFGPVLNDSGAIAFHALIRGPGITFMNNSTMWLQQRGEAPLLIARETDQAPGLTDGVLFGSMNRPLINAAGDMAFVAEISGPGTGEVPDESIWVTKGGQLELVVRNGDSAPGVTAGASRFAFFRNLVFNGEGEIAFDASLAPFGSFDNFGVWSSGSGELELVAKGRSQAPGTTGINDIFINFRDIILNRSGQTAFYASLSVPNRRGIWAEDASGSLKLIALEGNQMDVDDGPGVDLRTINFLDVSSFTTTGNEDGLASWFNDRGELAFVASFTDGTWGVFVTNLTALPTTLALVDIKPGGSANPVNPKSKGVLSVAILGTADFDVNDVDVDTLLFGDPLLIDNGGTAVSPLRNAYRDVSHDGFLDLTLKFSTRDLVEFGALGFDTVEGRLTGELLDGTPFEGMDSIRIVPPNGSNGNSLKISSVPEPTTCVLALAALCLAMRRRRST